MHDGGDHFVVFGLVHSLSEVPKVKPRPLMFYRAEYTGIEPDKNTHRAVAVMTSRPS